MSKFRFYSLGIVIKDKLFNSDSITVCPIEHLPDLKGNLNDIVNTKTNSSLNAHGAHITNSVNMSVGVDATWTALGSGNRVSSPNVRANETVMLYTFADTQEFYWTTIFREVGLRRTEDVIYMYGNIPTGHVPFDANSSYWMRVNTIDKYIQLHTSNNDGEAVGYDIIINTLNGVLSIADTMGNKIALDSTSGALNANINKTADLIVPTLTAECSSGVKVTTPTLKLIGNLEVDGSIHSTMDISSDANVNSKANVVAAGDVSAGAGSAVIGSSGATMSGPVKSTSEITSTVSMTAPVFNGNLNGSDIGV
jgi:hypothetical protein